MNENFDSNPESDGFMQKQDFLHIHNTHQLNESELFDTSALILDVRNEEIILKMLRRIRTMRYKSFYLKPVFLAEGEYSNEIIGQTDGILQVDQLPNILERVEKINARIQNIRTVTSRYSFSESLLVKTLQYLYTRKIELIPFRDRRSALSYCFPFLSGIITRKDQVVLLDVLEQASNEGLLESTLIDRVNLCKTCSGTYHNFREVCPKCGSLDLQSVDLIHHFRCAYIGPADDYKQHGALICPKCDKELRHIGIDYDKPSEIFNCGDCSHQAQEPNMRAHCIDCGEDSELEYLSVKPIYRYRLTVYGEEVAEHGLEKIDQDKLPTTDDQRILPFDTWQVMLRHEIQRVKISKTNSKIISVAISPEITDPMDPDTRRDFKAEVLRELASYIRPVDLLTSNNPSEIFVLFPDIRNKEIIEMESVFDYNLKKMIGDNLGDREDLITLKVISVDDDTTNFGA